MAKENNVTGLNWGILACGNIAQKFVLDAKAHGIQIGAVASRNFNRATDFSKKHNIPKAHVSYEALIFDQSVDIIYIALPSDMHVEWSIRAMQAGKHVLCEKPAAFKYSDCEAIISAAKTADVFWMEAFMYRLHPVWKHVKDLIFEGRIGVIQSLHSSFTYDMGYKPENIRQRKETAGGALLDVGCYCLSFSRMIMESEPLSLFAQSEIGIENGVDEWTEAKLEFPSNVTATFRSAMRKAEPHAAIIYGDKGRIEIPKPWHAPVTGSEIHLFMENGDSEVFTVGDGIGALAREALHVEANIISRQSPILSWNDSLGQAMGIEALRKSAGHV